MHDGQHPSSSARAPLDDVDLRLLGAYVEHPDSTVKALAAGLGMAESTCAYRLRLLRERGVITGTAVLVDMTRLGRPVQAVIRVRLANHSKSGVEDLFRALQRTSGVLQVFHIAGADDFLVHVAVSDAAALRDIVLEHITVHDVVRATETQLVFERREGVGVLG
ncbi:Lrp/AsnC family transcriptional regulator [Microbacterium resistens]|uniref:Lrp/AsnC family transcriptional regulator n=1 Tax=Microbacterium resistens TaxID=156977 RepID=A0ABY3RV93_9MICO|nr:Lrp/AsnC family transcriptional regulator [Microbacterium resistens]MBW1640974.1 Lrp/AsnC family transcriptional regulator [Microbacterium resistens]MDA4895263.1 Lrp/AsnC family transcriptional regulator [Streptomyces sp. MS2A]UGS27762.1 Lrp/AsnC family transcriptional regulator [Microbacterium resistens]